jgi:aspartate kinase
VLFPIVAGLGATLNVTERVSKVSVVGAGMRTVSGVAERMFDALAAEGVNLKMITTGDIKISVLIEEDTTPAAVDATEPAATEKIKKAHEESKKAVRGRKALRAVHKAFGLDQPRKGAGLPTDTATPAGQHTRRSPAVSADATAREAAVARLDGMEDVLVSGVHLNADMARITVFDLPDVPGNCARVFDAVAAGGILVDTIVQNITGPGTAELSFTVPKADAAKAEKLVGGFAAQFGNGCRVESDANIAVLYVLGVGMRTHTGVGRTMFGALAAKGINIEMINTSEVCMGVVIDAARGPEAVAALKAAFNV